ncbi:hypothetical protein ATO6_10705 [Oceanicola sp. 22II-s10i]|uniref:GIY-YIG nuclease family protein n=1 Tax=Oceanicola sp. 22II-s10i TaxID=1317116 RepID=UPI000B51FBCC|nr:GIY-YIG nuclease family protein [Oceanicola sp. 22II-s10i]OWU84783.1 hypothetical protein ATO6_10705 [Oceanicola sp. 22II-s10i]
MVSKSERKAAVAAWQEVPKAAGVYALRCAASGEVWVGSAPDLATIENRVLFTLRQGGNPHRSLQAAWDAHGADGVVFERLEELDPETPGVARARALKDMAARWRERLSAVAI